MLKRKVAYSGLEEALQRRRRRRRRMKSEDHNSLTPITAEATSSEGDLCDDRRPDSSSSGC